VEVIVLETYVVCFFILSPDNSVGIATCCRLDIRGTGFDFPKETSKSRKGKVKLSP
jgi:hypothetical protein